MIRRISKHNDLRDIVRSCPSGVIDDIYAIEYYTQGNETVIQAVFTKVGSQLEVILPASDLELLTDGILMRRAYYRVSDSSYPDGYYNLEFVESTNVWLGDSNGGSVNPSYVTEDELSSTLSSYATQDWVSSQQFLTSENLPSDIATKSWVQSQGYLTASTIPSDIATEEWVRSQGYLTASTIPSDIATQSWVSSYFYTKSYIDEVEINNDLRMKAIEVSLDESYATMSWVQSQGYVTVGDLPSGLATQSWVESYTYDKSIIAALAGKAQVDALSDAQEWVESYTYDKSMIKAVAGKAQGDAVYEVQTWVSSQQFATQSWVQSQGYLTSVPSEYATQSWVESYTYDSSTIGMIGQKATGDAIDWVQSQGYLTQHQDLTGYATESWVQSQGYVSTTDLSSYATKSWVSSNYFEESKIWVGTYLEWLSLSAEARSGYTIALIKE